ncbi:MAG: adenylosuccinate synthase, partial [Armatimonadetes bacterium]|nr:adenylosuccinate synthase [Armatimonadota bacterium]
AGHTVVVGGETFKLHLIPSGILHDHVLSLMGDGTVIDPECLAGEYTGLRERGVSCQGLRISGNAHVIMPYHIVLDRLQEESRGKSVIGTTLRGIGPTYTDKAARMPQPVRMWDLLDKDVLRDRVAGQLAEKNKIIAALYGADPLAVDAVVDEVWQYVPVFADCIGDTRAVIFEQMTRGANIIFEGAQGTYLDLDYGTYPFVTSSHPVAGAACLGTGVGPTAIDDVVIVNKAYMTRVGAGAFPTELDNDTGQLIRERGKEYGTTTGRPRRCGWLDGVALRTSAKINGATGLAVTLLDVLNPFAEIAVCTEYRVNGKTLTMMPGNLDLLADVEPVWEELPGWRSDLTGCRRLEDLPAKAQAYVARMSELAGVPLKMVSVGPGREETIII